MTRILRAPLSRRVGLGTKLGAAKIGAAVLGGSLLLSGCAGAQPGVAVRVGDETISVSKVNQLTEDYCEAYRPQLKAGDQQFPLAGINVTIVQLLAVREMTEQLADDFGVEPSDDYRSALAELTKATEGVAESEAQARIEVESATEYARDILTSVGRQQLAEAGAASPTEEEVLASGQDALQTWAANNDVEVDPQYGFRLDGASAETIDTSTSFAVSDLAKNGASVADPEADPEQAADYAASLPASQRCP